MRCPSCGHLASRVVDSRPAPEGGEIRRRRACESCLSRFTTYERVEDFVPTVLKRDGRREPFDREKVRRSVQIACRKRPVSAKSIERLVELLASRAVQSGSREVPTRILGQQALAELRDLDEVAFARFASVYLRFTSLGDFTTLAQGHAP